MKRTLDPKSLPLALPVWVVGSYGENRRVNLMTAAWGGLCGTEPPLVTVALHRESATCAGVLHHRALTIGVPGAAHLDAVELLGATTGRTVDKLEAAGLTTEPSSAVAAPVVRELPATLGCRLADMVRFGDYILVVGEVVEVLVDGADVEAGCLAFDPVGPLLWAPCSGSYHVVGRRLERPGVEASR